MDGDKVILAAFFLFVVLIVIRGRLHGKGQDRGGAGNRSHFRSVFAYLRIVVPGVLLVYMAPVLWKDFVARGNNWEPEVFLRCLIFVFTIYILTSEVRRRFRQKDGGKSEK